MAARRGDHGIHFDRSNNCYIGTISLGYDAAGKRQRRTVRGRTKTEVKDKLAALDEQLRAGVRTSGTYTVQQCVEDWLDSLTLAESTISGLRSHATQWVFPQVGTILLRDLKVSDLDRLFTHMAKERRRKTLAYVKSMLRRSIRRAQKHDLIDRNVADLTDLPAALPPRESRAMTIEQATTLLQHTEGTRMHALFALSFSLGMRPGELRALRWDDIDLDARLIKVRRALKNEWSERTLRIPQMAADALKLHGAIQEQERAEAAGAWISEGHVFGFEDGRTWNREDLRYYWSKATRAAGLGHWHPHEGRHTAVSILDHSGVPISKIADYVGHKSDNVTKTVYRHLITPEITTGADVMDDVFR